MTEDQLKLLLEYIDCRIDEKIQDAFGRDSGSECLKTYEARNALAFRLFGHYLRD